MSSSSPSLGRRDFVRQACCSAVGTTGLLSALTQLQVLGAVAGDAATARATAAALPPDYKALVCLFLRGGNDATNLIVPADAASHAVYAKARAELAVPQAALRPIAPRTFRDGRTYGLHPSVPELGQLFADGKLAVLANVGTLVQPTTLGDYRAGRALPPQLFSHYDQETQWQSSVPDKPFTTGWGGRLADLLDALNGNHQISMSISLNGVNSFQLGRQVTGYAVSPRGVTMLRNAPPAGVAPGALYTTQKAILAGGSANLLGGTFAAATLSALGDSEVLGAALAGAATLSTRFPGTETGSRLAMIAKLISLAPALGLKRQIFFVQLGGFDLHNAQLAGHGPLLAETSAAMKAFYEATVELGVANQVTTFTASDFGRTYVPNAGGTDHGWGNHQLVMGGAVKGGDIYGKMPSLVVGADDDTGRGRWIPSTSVDEYNATLATWFGVSAGNLATVLPNIGRFARPDLGFMA